MRTGSAARCAARIRVALIFGLTGCGDAPPMDVAPGVPLELANHRAATISDLRYNVSFVIPEPRTEPIRGEVLASFELSERGPVVFDFAQPEGSVTSVRVGGEPVPYLHKDEHLIIDVGVVRPNLVAEADGDAGGRIDVEVDFLAGDGSLNRQDDFLYALFVPDRARVALPIFDQPNLKARFTLELEVPAGWRTVANGSEAEHEVRGDREWFRFSETHPISTYLFSFAAGVFEVEEAERDGRRMAMYHRETDSDRVARNREEIFELHASALDWLEEYTGIPYPFEKFDFVLVPSFQFGGMEHPGAIFYRAERLLLDESVTQNELLGRASVIAHETAHQWFGDLVTMEWFNDVWMKETLANFLAAKIVNPSFPEVDHELRFLLAHYPAAYGVDRTEGTHPIRQELDNLDEAGTLYGAIIYQKAPIVLRHLEREVGEAVLREGLREFLTNHSYDSGSWPDLIAALDHRTDLDLVAWSRAWVEERGRPKVEVVMSSQGGVLTELSLTQTDPFGEGRLWPQRLDVLLGYVNAPPKRLPIQMGGKNVRLSDAAGRPVPDYILANGTGMGYGLMVLDARSREYLLENLPAIDEALTRTVAWVSLWDALLEGAVDPEAFIELALRALQLEPVELNVNRLLAYLSSAYWRYLPPGTRSALAERIEDALWHQIETADEPRLATAYFRAYRAMATTDVSVSRLERIWRGEEDVPGVPLSERELTDLAQGLALRSVDGSDGILAEQRSRIGNPDRRGEFDFVRPALADDSSTRDAFFESLRLPANRARESWVLSALGFLHHPLRASESQSYIRPSLDLLQEIQQTGDIFFPANWVSATLGGHQTASSAAIVRQYLDDDTELPPRLRAKVLQAADGLFRAAAITREN